MSNDSIRETISRFWEARIAGDKNGVKNLLAENASYEMVGAHTLVHPAAAGVSTASEAAEHLMDDFHFHDVEQLTAIIDGAKAAIVSRVHVSFRDGAPVSSEVCDLWEFNLEGKVISLKQFADTNLIRDMIGGGI